MRYDRGSGEPMLHVIVRSFHLLALAVLAACSHESAATQQIRNAASVDLDCEPWEIEFVDDSPMQKRVSGCGKTLTYMYKCTPSSGGGQDCRWKPVRDDANQL
jgi:hypothetical protein